MQLNKSTIIIILAALAVIMVASAFFLRPQGKVEFALAPEQAKLTINGKSRNIAHKQIISLSPGEYTFNIGRDEFSTERVNVTVVKSKTVRTVVALTPQTDAARKIIDSSQESVKITAEYKEINHTRLFRALPLSGVGYSVEGCSSIKYPKTDKKAICITSPTETGEETARLAIMQLGYNIDDYEVLSGKSTLKTFIETEAYKVEAYQNDPADRPQIYVTPLNVPYVPPNAPRNEQLESIRTAALQHLEEVGYNKESHIIVFSNMYLTRYNTDVHNHGPNESHND